MSAVRSSKFRFGLMLAMLLSVSAPVASQSYTPEQQQACSADAMRLCGAFVPDVDRITACMVENKSQLSPGCQVYFRPEPTDAPVAAGKPLVIKPAASRKPAGAAAKKSTKPKKPAKPAAT